MRVAAPHLLALALLATPAGAAPLTLDHFTDAFPPNPCLPLSGAPVIFTGAWCDGAACPPDPWAACEQEFALQTGLPGVLGGAQRMVQLEWLDPTDASAVVRTDLGRLEARTSGPAWSGLQLQYGDFGAGLDLDLVTAGASELRIPITGGVSASQPLEVEVSLATLCEYYYANSVVLDRTVTGPGVLVIPLAAFPPYGCFSFANVDWVRVRFTDCPGSDCPGPVPAREFAIGPITFESGSTAARRVSWGRLKTAYR